MAFVLRRLITPAIRSCKNSQCVSSNLRLLATGASGNSKLAPDREPKTKLTLSDSCSKRLREICKDGSFLRVTVEGGGCSGFQYKFELDNKMQKEDVEFGEPHAKVVIDETSLEYCAGSIVDYHSELIRSGFRVMGNPQAEQGCSCGASFAIKLD